MIIITVDSEPKSSWVGGIGFLKKMVIVSQVDQIMILVNWLTKLVNGVFLINRFKNVKFMEKVMKLIWIEFVNKRLGGKQGLGKKWSQDHKFSKN